MPQTTKAHGGGSAAHLGSAGGNHTNRTDSTTASGRISWTADRNRPTTKTK